MTKQFEYNGVKANVYWNEKSYNGKRYVKVSFANSRSTIDMIWTEGMGWTKNGGYAWVQQVADLLGFK